MGIVVALAEHLAPDSVRRLERAAKMRVDEAAHLCASKWKLTAVYLLGYSVEMCLAAAYFRSVGFALDVPITPETRIRRMTQARQILSADGEPLMSTDPHPLVGWARYLEWHRAITGVTEKERERLRDAKHRATIVYRHWRPSLRYKIAEVSERQLAETRISAEWFLQNIGRL